MSQDGPVHQLLVEGRVTQESVSALRASCEGRLNGGTTVLINLTGATFADQEGIQTLHCLERQGAMLVGGSGFLNELLRRQPDQSEADPSALQPRENDAERALVNQLRNGEPRAYEALVRQYGGRMLATARRLLNREEDAEDAVQDAFLSAFSGIRAFSGDSKLSTWLHRIVVNAALMKLRRRRRKPEESLDPLLPHFEATGEWAGAAPQGDLRADMLLERRETQALVRRCIDCLPASYRTVLILRDIEELDTDEVAALLRLSSNAVKIRLHRARQALRTLLERELRASTDGRGFAAPARRVASERPFQVDATQRPLPTPSSA